MQTNDIRLHTIQSGPEDGPVVILLHGFPEFWRGWRKQIAPLAKAGFRLIIPDQRGYNLSDKPSGVEPYRLEHLIADILSIIETAGQQRVSLVGHDWGGIVAWGVAMQHPNRLRNLAILNSPHPSVMRQTLQRNPRQIISSSYGLFFQIPRFPEAWIKNNDFELLVRTLLKTSNPEAFTEEDLEYYREAWWQTGAMTAMLNWYRANFRYPPIFPQDVRIHIPTLIIWGAQDIALIESLAQDSLDLCENGRLELFADSTHWVQHEKHERINEMLAGFLHVAGQ
ncbi:MAG: alpha/beta hydrolase [Anaerolineales bacterium]|nr:alpha/beta hydrolase [Anaerolineales bacterium]